MGDLELLPVAAPSVTSFLLKVASRCNLACDYCYMYEHADQSWREQPRFVSKSTARQFGRRLAEYGASSGLSGFTIVLHGGEPLLLGVGRMREILDEIRGQLVDPGQGTFTVQTNGVLLDQGWLELLSSNDVSVSISADGPRSAHDRHRLDRRGRPSYGAVERAIRLLREHTDHRRLFGGVLAVVDLANDPVGILQWAEDLGVPSIDFLLPDGTYDAPPPGVVEPGVRENAASYGRWLQRAFDYWFDNRCSVRVRLFENIVDLSLGGESRTEGIGPGSFSILTVETNGEIQDVDVMKITRHGLPRFGRALSIFDASFMSVLQSPEVASRARLARELPPPCEGCDVKQVCGAGHVPHRFSSVNGFLNPSVYCGDLAFLIRHISKLVSTELDGARL